MKSSAVFSVIIVTSFFLSDIDANAEVRTGNGLSPILDGRKFIVAIAPIERDEPPSQSFLFLPSADKKIAVNESRSTLTFEGGRICEGAVPCGLENGGVYRSTISGNAVTFDAETEGGAAERVVWRGTVRGSELFGTASRTTSGGGHLDYSFYGRNDE